MTTTEAPTTAAPNNPGNNDGEVIDCSAFYLNDTAVGTGGNCASRGWVHNIRSVEDCRAECAKVHDCKFFVWNSPLARKKKNSCFLKKNDKNKRSKNKDRGRISGPVTCDVSEAEELEKDIENEDGTVDCSNLFEQDVAVGRGRGNGVGRVNNIQSAEDCQAECQKVELCQFFIWNSPSARRKKLSCWLKKNNHNRKENDVGRISGPRSC